MSEQAVLRAIQPLLGVTRLDVRCMQQLQKSSIPKYKTSLRPINLHNSTPTSPLHSSSHLTNPTIPSNQTSNMSSPITFHGLTLLPVITGLKNAHAFISKAASHIESQNHDAADYLGASLAPDMMNFTEQVHRMTDTAKAIAPRVNPANPEYSLPDVESTFPELLERIKKTIAHLEGIDAQTFEGREDEGVTMLYQKGTIKAEFKALEYVQVSAQPNFW